MYLNDFRTKTVIEVWNYLIENNKDSIVLNRIMFVGNPEYLKDEKFGVLFYDSMFHRIYMNKLEGALYPNPDHISELAPKEIFIKNVKPSGIYNNLMQ